MLMRRRFAAGVFAFLAGSLPAESAGPTPLPEFQVVTTSGSISIRAVNKTDRVQSCTVSQGYTVMEREEKVEGTLRCIGATIVKGESTVCSRANPNWKELKAKGQLETNC